MNWMLRWLLCRHASDLGNMLLQSLNPGQRDKMARTAEALGREPTVETFTFVAYDEGGMMIGPTGAHRLVCVADCGARVVVFGHKGSLKNIDAILEAGLPCIVQCETHPASRTANRHSGHTHWVWEYGMLEAAPARVDEEVLEPRGTRLRTAPVGDRRVSTLTTLCSVPVTRSRRS